MNMQGSKSNPPKSGHVVADHIATYSDPIVLRRGNPVDIGKRDNEWPGWIWCTGPSGKSGWVPEAYLGQEQETAFAARDYDAHELSVKVGDRLTILEEESGWFLCRNESGAIGWVPVRNIEETATGD